MLRPRGGGDRPLRTAQSAPMPTAFSWPSPIGPKPRRTGLPALIHSHLTERGRTWASRPRRRGWPRPDAHSVETKGPPFDSTSNQHLRNTRRDCVGRRKLEDRPPVASLPEGGALSAMLAIRPIKASPRWPVRERPLSSSVVSGLASKRHRPSTIGWPTSLFGGFDANASLLPSAGRTSTWAVFRTRRFRRIQPAASPDTTALARPRQGGCGSGHPLDRLQLVQPVETFLTATSLIQLELAAEAEREQEQQRNRRDRLHKAQDGEPEFVLCDEVKRKAIRA